MAKKKKLTELERAIQHYAQLSQKATGGVGGAYNFTAWSPPSNKTALKHQQPGAWDKAQKKSKDTAASLDELNAITGGNYVAPTQTTPSLTKPADSDELRNRLIDAATAPPGFLGWNMLPLRNIFRGATAPQAPRKPTGENPIQEAWGDITGRKMTVEEMLNRMENAKATAKKNDTLATRLAASRYATLRSPDGRVPDAAARRFAETGRLARTDVIPPDVGTEMLDAGAGNVEKMSAGRFANPFYWLDTAESYLPTTLAVKRGMYAEGFNPTIEDVRNPELYRQKLLAENARRSAGDTAREQAFEQSAYKSSTSNLLRSNEPQTGTANIAAQKEGVRFQPQVIDQMVWAASQLTPEEVAKKEYDRVAALAGKRAASDYLKGNRMVDPETGRGMSRITYMDALRGAGAPAGVSALAGMGLEVVGQPTAVLDFATGAKAGANVLRNAAVANAEEVTARTLAANAAKSQVDDMVENALFFRPKTDAETIQGVRAIRKIPKLAPDAQRGLETALLRWQKLEDARKAALASGGAPVTTTIREAVEQANSTALDQTIRKAAAKAQRKGKDVQKAVQYAGDSFKAPYKIDEIERDVVRRFGDASLLDTPINSLDEAQQGFAKRAVGRSARDYSFLNVRTPFASSASGFTLPGAHAGSRILGDVLTAGGRTNGALDAVRGARFIKDLPFIGDETARLRNQFGDIQGDVAAEAKRQYLTRTRLARAESQRAEHLNAKRMLEGTNLPKQEQENLLADMALELENAEKLRTVREMPFGEATDLSKQKVFKNRVGVRTMNDNDIRLADFDAVHTHARANNGATIDLATGKPVDLTEGYMVSRPSKNIPVDDDKVTPEFIGKQIVKASKNKANAGAYGGMWKSDASGKWYFDVSDNIMDRDEAIARGIKNKQEAIWDNATGNEIDLLPYYVKGDPKRGLANDHPDAAAIRERIKNLDKPVAAPAEARDPLVPKGYVRPQPPTGKKPYMEGKPGVSKVLQGENGERVLTGVYGYRLRELASNPRVQIIPVPSTGGAFLKDPQTPDILYNVPKELVNDILIPAPKTVDQAAARQAGKWFDKFFSGATKGAEAPVVPWTPITDVDDLESTARSYVQYENGEFSEHIATSIPTFRENQLRKAQAIADTFGGVPRKSTPGVPPKLEFKPAATMLDIGGSEGGFAKTIVDLSDGTIHVTVLDPNPDMHATFKASKQALGANYVEEGFGMKEDFVDPETGDVIKAWRSKKKYDIVHESMAFQFFSDDRAKDIQQIKAHLKPGGVVFLEEKFVDPTDAAGYAAREAQKDAYKALHFTPEQLAKKNEVVGLTGEDAVEGMKALQADINLVKKRLQKEFKYVEEYWEAGNFKGFIASDDPDKVQAFMENYGGKRVWDGSLPEGATPVPSAAKPGKVIEVKGKLPSETVARKVVNQPEPSTFAEPPHFDAARQQWIDMTNDMIARTEAEIASGKLSPDAEAFARAEVDGWKRQIAESEQRGYLYHSTDVSPEEIRQSGGILPQPSPISGEPIGFSRPWQVGQGYGENEYRFPTNAAFETEEEFGATVDPFDTIFKRGIPPESIEWRNPETGQWEPLKPISIERSTLPPHVRDNLVSAGMTEDGTPLYYSAMLGRNGTLKNLADAYRQYYPQLGVREIDEKWDIATAAARTYEMMTSGRADEKRVAQRVIAKMLRQGKISETMAADMMAGSSAQIDSIAWVAERMGLLEDIVTSNNTEAQRLAREFGWGERVIKGDAGTRIPHRFPTASRQTTNIRSAEALLGIEPERSFLGRIKKPRATYESPELSAEKARMFPTLKARMEAGYETELNPIVASEEDLLAAKLRGINEEQRGMLGQATGRAARQDAKGVWRYADDNTVVPDDAMSRAQKSAGNAFVPATPRQGEEIGQLATDWGVNQKGARNELQDVGDAVSQSLIAGMTVMRPGFQAINEFGNIWNMLTMGEFSTKAFAQSADAILQMLKQGGGTPAGVRGTINVAGVDRDLGEFLTEAMEAGALSPLEFNPATIYREGADAGLYNVPFLGKYLDLMRTSNSVLENQSRLAIYIKALNDGASPLDARDIVNRTVYDYELNSLNRGEQWLRQYLPFFTFSRRNLPAQVKLLLTRPFYRNFAHSILETLDTTEGDWEANRGKNMQYQNEQGLNVHMNLPQALGGEAVVGFRPPLGDALTTLNALRALSKGQVGTAAAGLIGEQMNPGFQTAIGTITNTQEQGANLNSLGGFGNYMLGQTPLVGGALSALRREKKPAAFGGDPLAMERFALSQMTGVGTRNYDPYYYETQRNYELADALAAEQAWRRKRKEKVLPVETLEEIGWRTP